LVTDNFDMIKQNKTLPRIWFLRMVGVAVGIASIGISSLAVAQFVEPGSEWADSYPRAGYASQYRCENCQPEVHGCVAGDCRLGLFARGRGNVALLRHRETPPGNMGLHFPYQVNQMYYYRRPYNSFHVPTHVEESKHSSAQSSFGESLGYSNQVFELVHQTTEQHHDARYGGETEKDGLLEFVDWTQHRQSRLNWEAIPKYHSDYRDGSYPLMNEEVMNRRSNSNSISYLSEITVMLVTTGTDAGA